MKKDKNGGSTKLTFGKRRVGKHKKSNGPKDKRDKKDRGQG